MAHRARFDRGRVVIGPSLAPALAPPPIHGHGSGGGHGSSGRGRGAHAVAVPLAAALASAAPALATREASHVVLPIGFVAATSGTHGDNTGTPYTVTLNKPAGVAVGDMVLAVTLAFDTSGPYAITGLTQLDTVLVGSATVRPRATTYYRKIDGTEGASWSYSYTGGRSIAFGVVSYRPDGTKTIAIDAHQVTASPSGVATSITTPSAVATTSADMSAALFFEDNTFAWTTTGLTTRLAVNDSVNLNALNLADTLESASGTIAGKTGSLNPVNVTAHLAAMLILLKQS